MDFRSALGLLSVAVAILPGLAAAQTGSCVDGLPRKYDKTGCFCSCVFFYAFVVRGRLCVDLRVCEHEHVQCRSGRNTVGDGKDSVMHCVVVKHSTHSVL